MSKQPLTIDCKDGVYSYVEQPQMQVEVILASRHAEYPEEKPLYTVRMRYPRIIHGELMTHRMFSRNARSSRAVPVKTMLLECTSIPFIPWHWGKNQKGMQAAEECNERVGVRFDGVKSPFEMTREDAWLHTRNKAVQVAEAYMNAGYHKQIPNRLLEPFSWIDTLVTANDWGNFLWLRDHKDAEPHLQDLARLVGQALDNMEVQDLQPGEWHLPYVTSEDWMAASSKTYDAPGGMSATLRNEFLRKISAARCARISYKPFDGDASYERELDRYDHLVTSERVHASPTEHQASPDVYDEEYEDWVSPELHGNLEGWIQARKLIPNERHYG
ncbi:hypothetical protein PXK56_18535 [Phaeobacter gallaeciensis]|uniref:hypothetical protein n=1 Tax=Phaeobacter gallaeciensis TaxID=60890 RepID=UPI0023809145|nr:hypothetical protein [Phaeobacter gallaeciensis]MDE4297185.1 hypothetical protein [Phaeobacter gallaeciensis]